jgi:SAM-dependent methyltransferase
MSFTFNFGAAAQPVAKAAPAITVHAEDVTSTSASTSTSSSSNRIETVQLGSLSMRKVVLPHADSVPMQHALKNAVKDSDVVPGVYEGGFKLWECASDVISHMQSLPDSFLQGKRVLDLGCGHGLPGIYCLARGAQSVYFQDLNREVLQHVTAPNVELNRELTQTNSNGSIRLVAGDWRDDQLLSLLCQDGQFDLILSTDTLYSVDYMPALLSALKRCMSPTGTALIAAKRYYFGVGGSTTEFMKLIDADPQLKYQVVRVFENGASNLREIVQINWK